MIFLAARLSLEGVEDKDPRLSVPTSRQVWLCLIMTQSIANGRIVNRF